MDVKCNFYNNKSINLLLEKTAAYSDPLPHSPLGRSPKPGKSKILEFRGGTETGILNRSEMHFSPSSPTSQSSICSCLLPPAVLGSYCSIQGFGFQLKVGVTPKPLFHILKTPKAALGSSRAMAGIDLAYPCPLGFHGKELLLFLQITKSHQQH